MQLDDWTTSSVDRLQSLTTPTPTIVSFGRGVPRQAFLVSEEDWLKLRECPLFKVKEEIPVVNGADGGARQRGADVAGATDEESPVDESRSLIDHLAKVKDSPSMIRTASVWGNGALNDEERTRPREDAAAADVNVEPKSTPLFGDDSRAVRDTSESPGLLIDRQPSHAGETPTIDAAVERRRRGPVVARIRIPIAALSAMKLNIERDKNVDNMNKNLPVADLRSDPRPLQADNDNNNNNNALLESKSSKPTTTTEFPPSSSSSSSSFYEVGLPNPTLKPRRPEMIKTTPTRTPSSVEADVERALGRASRRTKHGVVWWPAGTGDGAARTEIRRDIHSVKRRADCAFTRSGRDFILNKFLHQI